MSRKVKDTPGETSRRDKLTERLQNMLEKVDDEGLEYLISRASEWIGATRSREERRKLGESLERLGSGGRINTPMDQDLEPSIEVVENKSGQSFIIVINGERNFMPLEEMRKIVALCHKAEDEIDGAKRLATWFQRFRTEVVRNSGLKGSNDPHLVLLYNYIISHYSVKE